MTLQDEFNTDMSDVNFSWKLSAPQTDFQNLECPNVSKKIRLAFKNNWAGKHVIAADDDDDIAAGELLAVEKPYAAVLFSDYYQTHCYHCFVPCQSMIPCKTCSQAMFCGIHCRETATNLYHRVECEVLPSMVEMDFRKVDHLAVRMLLQALKQGERIDDFLNHHILKNPFSNTEWEPKLSKTGELDEPIFMHFLADNWKELKMPIKMDRLFMAVFLLHILKQSTFFPKGPSDCQQASSSTKLTTAECYTGALLLKYLLIAKVNGFYLDKSPPTREDSKIGGALYLLTSCFNHSCNANVDLVYHKNEVSLYSTQPILAGEQLFVDYGASYHTLEKNKRQLYLEQEYNFNCHCDPCKYDWPIASKLKDTENPVFLSDGVDKENWRSMCERFRELVESISTDYSPELLENNLEFLREYMMFMHCNIKKPWAHFVKCQELLECIIFNFAPEDSCPEEQVRVRL